MILGLLYRYHNMRKAILRKKKERNLLEHYPDLIKGMRIIQDKTQSNSTDAIEKCYEIIEVVKKHARMSKTSKKKLKIVEIGSGRSTLAFALVCREIQSDNPELSITFESLEQSEEWKGLLDEIFINLNLPSPIKLVNILPVEGLGGRIESGLPDDTTLLYVDGPAVEAQGQKYRNEKGQPVYTDLYDAWESGIMPDVVMVDGRFPTIEYAQKSKASAQYKITYEALLALNYSKIGDFFHFNRHTIMERQ